MEEVFSRPKEKSLFNNYLVDLTDKSSIIEALNVILPTP